MTLQAQVTIGSGILPVSGALLDLKEQKTNGSANSLKGLGLPRVKLLSSTITMGDGNNLSTTIDGASGTWGKDEHIGLTVYNTNECVAMGSGIYVWHGTMWQKLGGISPNVYEVTDTRDGEVYLARNFGDAGDWMLENLRYIPKAADGYTDYIHTVANSYAAKHYVYPEADGIYTPSEHPSAEWESKKKNGLLYVAYSC